MERGSVQHGPRLDEALADGSELPLRGGGMVERDDRDPELPGDDEVPDARAHGSEPGSGLDADAVRERSELARWLLPSRFPADAATLLALARDEDAPAVVITDLERLPGGVHFATIGEIWRTLGGDVETRDAPEPVGGTDLGEAVAEAMAEVAAEVVADRIEEAVVDAVIEAVGAEPEVDEAVIEQAVEDAVVVAAAADAMDDAVVVVAELVPEGSDEAPPRAVREREWAGDVHDDRPPVVAQAVDLTIAVVDLALIPARIGFSLLRRILAPGRH